MNKPVLSAKPRDVVVIHEMDGRKYLEALTVLAGDGRIDSLSFHTASVLWRLAHCMLRERRTLSEALPTAARNFAFRCRLPFLKDKIVILCIAPWDWRMTLYAMLLRRNVIVYNSSWPWWDIVKVPRRYGFLSAVYRFVWQKVLRGRNVTLTVVTSAAASGIEGFLPGRKATVIPHVVSEPFFSAAPRRGEKLKLLYVGELSKKKGFLDFMEIACRLAHAVEAEVIGDGPLRPQAEAFGKEPGRRWHGRMTDRQRQASIVSECHLLVSPALRTASWEELFGMAIAESMAAGLVPIVTSHVGPRSFIRHGVNGVLIEEGDQAAAEVWIRRLGNDRAMLAAMSDEAISTATSFRIARVAEKWDSVLTRAEV